MKSIRARTLPTERQDFIKTVMPHDLLDDAIEWIKDELQPEEVFDASELADWAEDNLSAHRDPDDIFDDSVLGKWAEENGYVEKTEGGEDDD